MPMSKTIENKGKRRNMKKKVRLARLLCVVLFAEGSKALHKSSANETFC